MLSFCILSFRLYGDSEDLSRANKNGNYDCNSLGKVGEPRTLIFSAFPIEYAEILDSLGKSVQRAPNQYRVGFPLLSGNP